MMSLNQLCEAWPGAPVEICDHVMSFVSFHPTPLFKAKRQQIMICSSDWVFACDISYYNDMLTHNNIDGEFINVKTGEIVPQHYVNVSYLGCRSGRFLFAVNRTHVKYFDPDRHELITVNVDEGGYFAAHGYEIAGNMDVVVELLRNSDCSHSSIDNYIADDKSYHKTIGIEHTQLLDWSCDLVIYWQDNSWIVGTLSDNLMQYKTMETLPMLPRNLPKAHVLAILEQPCGISSDNVYYTCTHKDGAISAKFHNIRNGKEWTYHIIARDVACRQDGLYIADGDLYYVYDCDRNEFRITDISNWEEHFKISVRVCNAIIDGMYVEKSIICDTVVGRKLMHAGKGINLKGDRNPP